MFQFKKKVQEMPYSNPLPWLQLFELILPLSCLCGEGDNRDRRKEVSTGQLTKWKQKSWTLGRGGWARSTDCLLSYNTKRQTTCLQAQADPEAWLHYGYPNCWPCITQFYQRLQHRSHPARVESGPASTGDKIVNISSREGSFSF